MDRADSLVTLSGIHEALAGLCRSVSLPITDLQEGETVDRVEVDRELGCSSLLGLSLDSITKASDCLGSSLSVSFSSQYGIRPFSVRNSEISEAAFSGFMEDIRAGGQGEKVKFRLIVDKRQLLRFLRPPENTNVVVFVFLSNLLRALSGRFEEIQEIFFPKIQCRSICVLLEGEERLSGAHFSVVGPEGLEREFSKRPGAKVADRISRAWETRKDNVSWIDFETKLTPFHFMLRSPTRQNTRVSAAIAGALYALTVLYLADSVRRRDEDYVATFSGITQSQLLVQREADTSQVNLWRIDRVFIWAYSADTTDKLAFLRSVVPSYLGDSVRANYPALGNNIGRIWEDARANYASFVTGFVTHHFEKLKEVDEYVRETSSQVSEQISELSGNIVTTMLATVGVVVGGVIAYSLNGVVTPKLLSIGLRAYGLYIGLFPLFYFVIIYSLTSYLITVHDFETRMRDFEVALHASSLSKRFSGTIKPRKIHFWVTFLIAFSIYGGLVFACFRAAAILTS